MSNSPLKILRIDSSARKTGSVTRDLTDLFIDRLASNRPVQVKLTDVSQGLPFLSEDWIGANFTPSDERTAQQRETLALSDQMIADLKEADLLVIGTPVYNFGIPATLKAWIDLVARAGETFRYTEQGPVGLLEGKRAVILAASGGTQAGSDIDFATPYLRHALGFIGISDVQLVAADQLMMSGDDKISATREHIHALAA